MTIHVDTPLQTICAAVAAEHGFDMPSGVDQAEELVKNLLEQDEVDRRKLAAALLILGWTYRLFYRHEEAERMYVQARGRFTENPLEFNRDTARANWFLAESNFFRNNHDVGRTLFWKAIREFSEATGLFDEEARACVEDFWHCATGIVKDDELAGEIEDVMEFTDFCQAEGCDGHITILAV